LFTIPPSDICGVFGPGETAAEGYVIEAVLCHAELVIQRNDTCVFIDERAGEPSRYSKL
jgi:hypothetical protein